MRDLKIAYGNSRQAKFWSNKTIKFDELCDRLRTPIRTSESAEEYTKLPKAQRDEIKDKGGFVAGHLRDNRRQANKVECRSMLVYDLDGIQADFLKDIGSRVENKGCYYTTHSHLPERPRARMVIPVTRDMTADEFNAAVRYYAADNGFISMLDPCSFSPHQLMYWPTCPSNGEYLVGVIEGAWLDPDTIFAKHPNWRDCSLLPTTPKESKAAEHGGAQQKDPLEKDGVVGLFNRVFFPISTAIDTFLSEVYAPTADNTERYDYLPGEGSAGVVVYDDKFTYSHHATDPAGGKLCNAFDLVRLHKFGDDANKSFKEMCEFALAIDKVKIQLALERKESVDRDFGDNENWESLLKYQPRSNVLENSVWNEMLILNNDLDYANFAFNEMANRVQITGTLPWDRPKDNKFWRDADTAQMKALIDIHYVPFSSRNHEVSFTKVADDRRFHPVRDYLNGLPKWDGKKRVENLLIRYLQADNTDYVKTVTRKTFAAAVARIYHPGVKYDCVLVLDGIQGIGKSTLFKDLVGDEYYSETLSLTDMNDKSGAEKLQGFWIMEIAELAGMKKADIEKVKAFLSTSDDKYRPSYGKTVESHPRQCIIIASVNGERGYLRDITGNRRFWVVKLNQTEQKKTWHFTQEDRDQIWAESKYYYENGEKLYLEGDMISRAEEVQRDAMEVDERQGMVEEYLETLLPLSWESMDVYARKNYLAERDAPTTEKGITQRNIVSNAEIWCECFGRSLADLKPADSYAIAALMTQIDGWQRTSKIRRCSPYGKQRLYERTCCLVQNTDN